VLRLLLPALLLSVQVSAADWGTTERPDDEILASDFREMSLVEQRKLVTGMWYGVTLWAYHIEKEGRTPVGATPQNAENEWLMRCNAGKTSNDMIDLYNQYLDSHPELWHFDIGTLFVLALQERCNS